MTTVFNVASTCGPSPRLSWPASSCKLTPRRYCKQLLLEHAILAAAIPDADAGESRKRRDNAHTTRTMELDNGMRIEAANVIEDLNSAMRWLSYPGRKNAIATAEEVVFAAP